ncbi:hypothetical protein [Roseobacter phage RDJL3]|nr:hypothetical protein [Roseobacter phage RDJL3]
MSDKPTVTHYSSSTTEAVETAWKLKRLTETHEMRQRKLVEEYRAKSSALTDEMQAEQSAVFDGVRDLMGIPDVDWGDGKSWALNIENLADGTVALIHDTDPSRQKDDCDCPICQLRRVMTGTEREDEVEPVIH